MIVDQYNQFISIRNEDLNQFSWMENWKLETVECVID